MTDRDGGAVTEADWIEARARTKRAGFLTAMIVMVVIPAMALPVLLLTGATTSGLARYPVAVGWFFLLMLPVSYLCYRVNIGQQERSDRLIGRLTAQQEVQVRRETFGRRLANALDMAEGEPEVIEVIERSFASTLPDQPVELLLADNSHAHLLRMAHASPTGIAPGCGVDSPDHCPAARRAQVQHFSNSEDLDACPKLRGRPEGALSALCVPVSIMGRTVGVIHATAQPHASVAEVKVADLGTLANLAGARIGLLRVMAETQLQAATDSLTGLLNRRAFERKVTAARVETAALALAMSDLDHFKTLNDTYGHETGDRALRLFAQVLTESVRTQDLVCRHGGEEFVIALPGCSADKARVILDALRVRLDAAITVAGLPAFTVSFGVIEARGHEDLPALISRADTALFQAKRDGRNRVVVHDIAGNAIPPAPGLPELRSSDGRDRYLEGGGLGMSALDVDLTHEDPSAVGPAREHGRLE